MDVKKLLSRLGLNSKEAQVFLALAKLGPSPVRAIAVEAGVNRGTTYDTLKRLLSLGLVSYYHQDKHQYFVAESPERLAALLEERIAHEEETKRELDRLRPTLDALYARRGEKPAVKYYEGFRGAKAILRDVLDTMGRAERKAYAVYSSLDLREHLYKEFPNFNEERVERGIRVRTISFGSGGELHGLDERRWLTRKQSAPTYVLLYDGKVATLSLDKSGSLIGILIESQAIAATERMIFDRLWDTLANNKPS
ncbi:MAG: TrmB family transcriptional regulator [Candidatus Kerfeldbacteria bacterium]|nr:TrmB family transcriptional regulator [Candidatus Kerfeldbacteria bacterium]